MYIRCRYFCVFFGVDIWYFFIYLAYILIRHYYDYCIYSLFIILIILYLLLLLIHLFQLFVDLFRCLKWSISLIKYYTRIELMPNYYLNFDIPNQWCRRHLVELLHLFLWIFDTIWLDFVRNIWIGSRRF